MTTCSRCVEPDTRPGITLDREGVCGACRGHEEKTRRIDWTARRRELESLLERFRSKDGSGYDCVVPVSGGKDSTYQVYMMKRVFGMRPLAVTYRYADRTPLGQKNLDALRGLGVDHLEFAPAPEAERRFVKKALLAAGDPCIPDHLGIFAVTLRTAVNFRVPLIVWGENPQMEYGGSAADRDNPFLGREWLRRHGTLQGKTAEDWADSELSAGDLALYRLPTEEELDAAKLSSIFLGYYLRWDPVENYRIASSVGFQKSPDGPKMGIYDFADLDSTNMIVHHYIKWLKFGMTRLHDNISVEIRNGRMTKEEGLRLLEKGERVPAEEVAILCRYLGMTEASFWEALEKFRDGKIWKKDSQGRWHIPGPCQPARK